MTDDAGPVSPVAAGLSVEGRSRRGLWISAALLTAAVLVAGATMLRGRSDEGQRVRVAPVEQRGITQKVLAQGKVRARTQVDVASEIGGRVARVAVQIGDIVKPGDLLFALDDEQLKNAVEQLRVAYVGADAVVRRATLAVQEATRGVERDRALRDRGVLPEEQLKLSESRAELARADLKQAEANVERTRLDMQRASDALRRARVLAPIGGTIVAVGVEVGQVVSAVQGLAGGGDAMSSLGLGASASGPGAPVVIADLSELIVKLDVDELDVGQVKEGQRAVIRAQGLRDVTFEGTVERVGLMGRDQAGAVLFVVEVGVREVLEAPEPPSEPSASEVEGRPATRPPTARDILRPGMSAQAEIEVRHLPDARAIPMGAVLEGDGDKVPDRVFVYTGDLAGGSVAERPVRLGPSDSDTIAILSGVDVGERVIEGPYRALRSLADGDLVVLETQADKSDKTDKIDKTDKTDKTHKTDKATGAP